MSNNVEVIKKQKRGNSMIEILRILFLFFLIFTHSTKLGLNVFGHIDTNFIKLVSQISVVGFAAIMGIYIYNNENKRLFGRNIRRLLFIIISSIVISVILFKVTNNKIEWQNVLTGSRDS